jgi:hypothetical protein
MRLRSGFEEVAREVDASARVDKELAGKYLLSLIRTASYLRHSLPKKLRMTLIDNLIEDGLKDSIPHQFEREEDRECDLRSGQCVPKPDATCIRDTWTNKCIGSG